ncbi:RagB/SusD family nutrient uptake outer membrane protein [Muricauda sp. TY007]|uniref:RagB/SusD family nutrient uptake outer membrane protein n=1 Tax=Allomuricauda sp. TY007 TaxID=2683200 RepID=UPI0013BEDACC|nr:RagB/SusD family nutrient uptake outer membrane protein [Muricauda sp. TY007]NDV15759.1 RagB/SusD family nutrient uptake outer membrane protein [Muricauda sp. TY007]
MKKINRNKLIVTGLLLFITVSCDDFIEVEVPADKLTVTTVFESNETARSAMQGIYNELFRSISFCSGGNNSVTALVGLSSGELFTLLETDLTYREFEENEINPNNPNNLNLWNSAYNLIYMTNSMLEGVLVSKNISDGVRDQLEGEARFIRAFTYFNLVNLYGEVPLILSTDYRINAQMGRTSIEEVYDQILTDLHEAIALLEEIYKDGERTIVNRFVAEALLARIYLYRQQWALAEVHSTNVINQSAHYDLLEDLDQVFLMNSKEAIWQISPTGLGSSSTNTKEGALFVSNNPKFAIAEDLALSIEPGDKRTENWIGLDAERNAYYPYKYKDGRSTNNITEYSMVFRLAEQYLIRAEARTRQGNILGGISDVDKIKGRADVDLLSETNPDIDQVGLIEEILDERKKELFTEWGHRWFDLKRTGKSSEILGNGNPLWQDTDVLFPIPEQERMKNTNLGQNEGY